MRVFSRLCARFPGWLPMYFCARKRFLEVCTTTFLANRAGICPHIARRVISTRGTRCAQEFQYSPSATRGRTYATIQFFFGKKMPKNPSCVRVALRPRVFLKNNCQKNPSSIRLGATLRPVFFGGGFADPSKVAWAGMSGGFASSFSAGAAGVANQRRCLLL